jgi:carbonic anhydrase
MPPSDVVLTHGPESLRVETFAIVQGKKSQEAAYWESMSSHIMVAELRHNVSVNGSISQKATLAVTGLVFDVRTGRTQLVERRAPLRS